MDTPASAENYSTLEEDRNTSTASSDEPQTPTAQRTFAARVKRPGWGWTLVVFGSLMLLSALTNGAKNPSTLIMAIPMSLGVLAGGIYLLRGTERPQPKTRPDVATQSNTADQKAQAAASKEAELQAFLEGQFEIAREAMARGDRAQEHLILESLPKEARKRFGKAAEATASIAVSRIRRSATS